MTVSEIRFKVKAEKWDNVQFLQRLYIPIILTLKHNPFEKRNHQRDFSSILCFQMSKAPRI